MIQNIIFNKDKWTAKKAVKWLLKNNYKVIEIDETDNYYKFPQFDANPNDKYYTKEIGKDIKFVIKFSSGLVTFK